MNDFQRLFDLACGHPIPEQTGGTATRGRLVVMAILAAAACAALWGVSVGAASPALALGNLVKLPMVVVMSVLAAAPAALIAWRLSATPCRLSDFVMSVAGAMLGGCLLLAAVAPLVALYYHSSSFGGPVLAQASALLSIVVGGLVLARGLFRSAHGDSRKMVAIPAAVFTVVHLAALLQLISIVSPILPNRTVFADGVDALVHHGH